VPFESVPSLTGHYRRFYSEEKEKIKCSALDLFNSLLGVLVLAFQGVIATHLGTSPNLLPIGG